MKRGIIEQLKDIVQNKGEKIEIPAGSVPIGQISEGGSPPKFDSFSFADFKSGLVTKEGIICPKCGNILRDNKTFKVHRANCS